MNDYIVFVSGDCEAEAESCGLCAFYDPVVNATAIEYAARSGREATYRLRRFGYVLRYEG